MIRTRKSFETVVEMYKLLREFGEGVQCDHSVGICACGLFDVLEDGRKLIEKSAVSLGYVERKGKGDEWEPSKKKKVK